MKRFVIRLFVFLSIMFILDRGFGVVMKYLLEHAKGGYVGHHNYILNQANEDMLIFGSSRAIHHYNPKIISDSLGYSCYNCGQNGNGIVLFYGWWQIIKERFSPKMIVYDVNPRFDLLSDEDNHKYLGWLRSEYDNDGVKKVFDDVDPTEKYKMTSMMYRYNSKFLQNIIDYIHPIFNISSNGYLPLRGDIDKMKIKEDNDITEVYKIDSLKIAYVESLVKDTKERGIRLVFVASPIWYGMNEDLFTPLKCICEKYGVEFYNYSNNAAFIKNDVMFKDGTHLNSYGADVFTKLMSSGLR